MLPPLHRVFWEHKPLKNVFENEAKKEATSPPILINAQRLLSDYVLKERKNQMRTVIDVLSLAQKMF